MFDLPRCVARALFALPIVAALGLPATAQTSEKYPYLATISADDVFVRSGADFGFYGTGTLQRGDVVKVIGERAGFSRVQLVGPAFESFYGYIILPSQQTDRFRLNPDGKTGTTLGRIEVLGPNMQEDFDPAQSWKPLARLTAEQTVLILDTTTSETQTIHKVALPEVSEGWISANLLRLASADEQKAWFAAIDAARSPTSDAATASAAGPETAPVAGTETTTAPSDTTTATATNTTTPAPPGTPPVTPTPTAAAPPTNPQPDATTTATSVATPATTAPVLAREEQVVVTPPAPAGNTDSAATTDTPVAELAAVDLAAIEPETAQARAARKLADMTIEDLDAAVKRMAADDPASAEVEPLRQAYLGFAERHAKEKSLNQYASARAEQLKLWAETQQSRAEIDKMKMRAQLNEREAEAMVRAMNARGDYAAIGRLDASTIYDGVRLPRLYRIRDVNTGRTIGYMLADEEGFNLTTMLGTLIGVVGETNYESGLRVDLIKPRRIDLLQPQE